MRPIAFYPQLAKILGNIEAAIYYQQLIYWSDKGSRDDGFIYKTKEDIEQETTLSRFQQDRCRKQLEEAGWLETKLIRANGHPTVHYKCLFNIELSISKKLANGKVRNLLNEKRETDEYITETTTETTHARVETRESEIKIVSDLEGKEKPTRVKKITDDMKAVFNLFDNPAKVQWGLREIERVAAQTLYDTYGLEVLERRLARIKKEQLNNDPHFPLITTPSQLLDKMPSAERYLSV